MLAGLDQIDWSQLSHAYGNASDLPELIRNLAAGSAAVCEAALHELYAKIWHQGNVYEATAFAVPFLLELAEDPATPDRSGILDLLQSIAEGWLDFQRYSAEDGKFVPPETAARYEREGPDYRAAHEAVASGFDGLAGLLCADEVDVRAGSVFVLAMLTKRAGEVVSLLLDALDAEGYDWCRGSLLLALMVMARNAASPAITEVVVRWCESAIDEPKPPFSALSAGIALLQLNRATAVPRVLEMARPRLVEDREIFIKVPWHETGELYSLIARSLSGMPRQRLRWIIDGLNHSDEQIRQNAMFWGGDFCKELRWGPAELIPSYALFLQSRSVNERRLAIQDLGAMGAAGVAYLKTIAEDPLADVRQ